MSLGNPTMDLFDTFQKEEEKKREKIGSLKSLKEVVGIQDYFTTTLRVRLNLTEENNTELYQDAQGNEEDVDFYDDGEEEED